MGSRVAAAPARRAALSALGEVRRRDGRARDVMRASGAVSKLPARDVALAERLVLGVTATRGALDALLDGHLSKPRGIQPRVRDALRLSAFELLYLGTPAAVAASQGVELVRGVAPRAAGLANAVLRRVADEDVPRVRAAMDAVADGTADASACALAAGWPEWLADRLAASVGTAALCEMAACALDPAPVWVSGNPALHDADATRALLEDAGLSPRDSGLAGAWLLPSARGLAPSGLVESADVVVSDLAARLVALVASPAPGSRVLEIGQGRGTKTLLLEGVACAAGGPADVTGVDCVPFKTRVAAERLSRGWDGLVRSVTADASDPSALPDGPFDLVFVDAPCSGTGTMRRHPEIAWDLRPESLAPAGDESLPALQLAILRASATRVAPGGALAYSTCSPLDEEDSAVVAAFLASPEGSDFAPQSVLDAPAVAASPEARVLLDPHVGEDGTFRSHPRAGTFDGHFCARFVRSRTAN